MATALQLVNAVLRRLRESEVTDFNKSYTKLILDFVNETKREIEDAWNWTSLRQTKEVTTSAGTQLYTLTGAGQRFRLYDPQERMYDSTNKIFVWPSNSAYVEWNKWLTTTPNSQPNQYRFIGQTSSYDPQFELFPVPNGTFLIKVPVIIPQNDLVNPTDIMTVPGLPVILGSQARAFAERGEDNGTQTLAQWTFYDKALADFISMDAARAKDELVWIPF